MLLDLKKLFHKLFLFIYLQMELCLNTDLIKKWKRMLKREAKEAAKRGEEFDPSTKLEVKFLRNLIEEFLEVGITLSFWCLWYILYCWHPRNYRHSYFLSVQDT